MNEKARLRLALGIGAMLALSACSGGREEAPPLEGARVGGPFTLTDQNGRQVSDSDFAGRYRLVYFGYASCPDVCPTDLQAITVGLEKLERSDAGKAARIQPIFISVDPARDTPAVLKEHAASFHPRLLALTGSEQQIARVKKDFAAYASARAEGGSESYLVDHSRRAFLLGPQGEPIALIPHTEGPDAISGQLDRWVR